MVGADGRVRWVRDRGRMRVEDGRRFLDGSVLDVTEIRSAQLELEAARAEAQRLADVDHLTGVSNRRSLARRLEQLGTRLASERGLVEGREFTTDDQSGPAVRYYMMEHQY